VIVNGGDKMVVKVGLVA